MPTSRPLAVITGASSGIGFHLAMLCGSNGFDLIVAADQGMEEAATMLAATGASVEPVTADLSTQAGVDDLLAAIGGRKVDALLANAGHGLGRAFLDQPFEEIRSVIDTNVTGTLYLVQHVGKAMRVARSGRILITGSIAGFMPGTFQAVYNGTKAFIDSFSRALRNELKGSGVTVTCLMPGATDTHFFARADDMLDTWLGTDDAKADPADVAEVGFKAMMGGGGDVVAGWKNKIHAAFASITPSAVLGERHRKVAGPCSAH
jgi:short-subunit dehydrogenase